MVLPSNSIVRIFYNHKNNINIFTFKNILSDPDVLNYGNQ